MNKKNHILLIILLFVFFNSSNFADINKNKDYGFVPPPKSITVTVPNNGEVWLLNSTHNITWSSSGISTVRIQLSTDNGTSWQTIVASQNASVGSYSWDINSNLYTPSTQALIKIFDVSDATVTDISDNVFTLSKLEILSPITGTKFQVNKNANILWSASSDISTVNLEYSVDRIGWISIADNIDASTGLYSWFVPNTPASTVFIRIKDSNIPDVISAISSEFSISFLQVLTPNGGEVWFGGSQQLLTWSSNTVSNINILYSTDNGLTWISDTTVAASSQNISWTVPSVPTNEALVNLVDADASNVFDESDNIFTINSISVTSPNGNEGWKIGSSVSINWAGNLTGNVTLELSTDNGSTWGQTLVSGISAATGNYNLTVPNLPTDQALVRISNDADPTQFAVSNNVFTIGQLNITQPTAGETLQSGSIYHILWNATVGINNVKIEYTTDGINYTTITSSANGQTGDYTWLIPLSLSASNINIRISDVNTGLAISDVSNSFSISSLQLTSPVGGELWTAGTSHNITWTNSSEVTQIFINYSTDAGASWANIASSLDASSGLYVWNIPNTISSSQMRIKISDPTVSAKSSSASNFKIGNVSITSPDGGEKLFAGSNYSITWNISSNINSVNLQYSLDGGVTFNNIVTGFQASTLNYRWLVPVSISSNNALIRIYDSDGLGIADSSNSAFTIENLQLLTPNGGEGYLLGAPITINWSSSYVTNVKIEFSSDGINFIPFTIITDAAAQSYVWQLGSSVSGATDKARFRISDADNPGFFDYSDSSFTLEQITVNSPNGNEIFQTGTIHPISWSQSFLNHNINLEYSVDSGLTWNSIISGLSVQSPYNWTVPNAPSQNVKIRVSNSSFSNIFDTSDSFFNIEQLQLTSPNGGEYFLVDSSTAITWQSGNVNNVKIEYSTNNGLVWNSVISSTPAASGLYNWLVPNTSTRNALIKISDADNLSANITDQSNSSFVISALNLTSPNGGENFVVNSTQTISWISNSSVTNVNLEFSANGGTSWSTIASGINAAQQSYGWTIPNNPTSNGLIRIINSANTSVMDTSDAVFSIGSIQLTAPNGGERFQVDSLVTITWNNIASISTVNLAYSTDNGTTWNVIASNVNANLEQYIWTVANAPTSSGLIKIEDSNNTLIFDKSNSNFTISNITVTSPNGGEILQAGSSDNITWTSSFVNNINIDYSLDNGLTWNNIATGIAANLNSFLFSVPNTSTTNGIIRISDSGNPLITDKSDNVFVIEQLHLTSPIGGEGITSGSTIPISWTAGNIGNINIYYSSDSGVTWINIAANISALLGSYNWVVPTVSSTTSRIKISDTNNGNVVDSSNSDFIIGNIAVTNPSTGITWKSGSIQNITWNASTSLANVKIEYTIDNSTWNVITNSYNASLGSYVWTLPDGISTTQAQIKVSDTNTNSTITDLSGLFIINALKLTSPNGGEYLESGSTQKISWSSTNITDLNIQFSVDNGSTWNLITSSTSAATGFYNWVVPSTLSSKLGLIKIADVSNSSVKDSSDAVFNFGRIKYISPLAGSFLQSGKTVPITWQNSISVDNISIDYSTNGGTSWANITSSAIASAGSYNWTIPSSISTSSLKLRVSDAASNLAIIDESGLLSASYLNLLSPVGNENWLEGSSQIISWNAGSLISNLSIEYSVDSGNSWNNISSSTSASAGSYSWTVPQSISNSTSLVRIIDVNNTAIRDSSSNLFIISNITLASPIGGENWQANTTHQILFSTLNINLIDLDYSTDNGVSWSNIISNQSVANGNFAVNWNIPKTINTTQAKIRVVSSNDATQEKESNVFTITKLNLISPIGSENWQTGTTQTVLWESGNVAQVNLYYSIDNGNSWNVIAQNINASLTSFDWNIPLGITTSSALVKIEDVSNNSFVSVSPGVFTISSLVLTSPVINDQLQSGTLTTIRWQGDSSIQNVDLEYSTDSGSTWINIKKNVASSGSLGWSVPNSPTNQAIVRVLNSADRNINSESGLFTISELLLFTPDGSKSLNAGNQTTISWSSSFVNNISIDFSSDGGSNWSTIVSSIPASATSFIWNVPTDVITNSGLVRVKDVANIQINSTSSAQFRVGKITVISPNGGEFISPGKHITIKWSNSNNINNVELDYSTNGGIIWTSIRANIIASQGSYNWIVPFISSSNVVIRISDLESANSLYDISDNSFTITTLAVIAPNGGENLRTGNNYNITWASGIGISTIKLEYLDKVGTWETIANNINASLGQYNWLVPNAAANWSRIRMSSEGSVAFKDSSDGTFRIAQLDLNSPNGNEIWQSGTVHNISWVKSLNLFNVDIYYSTDSGTNWNSIISNVITSNSYNWKIPDIESNSMLVKVVDAASNNQIIDTSNAVFTISRLKFTNPLGGENIIAGSNLNIKWHSSTDISQVDLSYSTDNGTNWNAIQNNVAAGSGNYDWQIPSTLNSTNSKLLIKNSSNNLIVDTSGTFNIYQAGFSLISPNGNEYIQAGKTAEITWVNGTAVNFVDIYYSLDSGANWISIINNYDASLLAYQWIVPSNISSDNSRIRIIDSENSIIRDSSDLDFSIRKLDLLSPNGGEVLQANTVTNILWNSSSNVNNIKIELSTDLGANWFTINSPVTASANSFSWLVNNIPTTSALIRISDISATNIFDTSGSPFTISQLLLTFPNGGERIKANDTLNVSWVSSSDIAQLRLEYSTDGVSWSNITSSPVDAALNSYNWAVPDNLCSTNGFIRISNFQNTLVSDINDTAFKFSTLDVLAPLSGQIWTFGTTQDIKWRSCDIQSVRLEYSIDSGLTWLTIADSISAITQSYSWTIPNVSSQNTLVRISDIDDITFSTISSQFIISSPAISLIAPKAGDNWQSGTQQFVRWLPTSISTIDIDLSTNAGLSWQSIINNVPATDSQYVWNIPDSIETTSAMIKITDNTGTIKDSTHGTFTISKLILTYPIGGEFWQSGKSENITWNAGSSVSAVKLQYSLNFGDTWVNIAGANSIDASLGNFVWNLPSSISSDSAKIRILDIAKPVIFSQSDNPIKIGWVTVNSPNGGEIAQINRTFDIVWDNSSNIQNVTVQLINLINNSVMFTKDTVASVKQLNFVVPSNSFTDSAVVNISDAQSGNAINDTSDGIFRIVELNLLEPALNTNWKAGTTHSIKWNSNNLIGTITLQYSTDSGGSWNNIISGLNITDNNYDWAIPSDLTSNNSKIKIVDDVNPSIIDTTGNFNIFISGLTINSPKGGEYFNSTDSISISWSSSFVSSIKIEFSPDSGSTWNTLASSILTSSQLFKWLPASSLSTNRGFIKITDIADSSLSDISTNPFTIGWINILSPNGGETVIAGKSQNISWESSSSVANINLYYTKVVNPADSDWIPFALNLPKGTTSYNWNNIPNLEINNAHIVASDASSNKKLFSFSNLFKIQRFKLLSPNGGEAWQSGQTQQIKWDVGNSINNISIEYSIDNGITWEPSISNSVAAADSIFNWTIPQGINSDSALVRITDIVNNQISDTSDAVFQIGDLTLLSFNNGERILEDKQQTILWSKGNNTNFINLDYKTSNNGNWIRIVSSYPADSLKYDWNVPKSPSDSCFIRILDAESLNYSDISNLPFTIVRFNLLSFNGGEVVQTGTAQEIRWESKFISNIAIQFTSTDSIWVQINPQPVNANLSTFTWNIPANINAAGTNYKIRLIDVTDNSILVESKNPFTITHIKLVQPNGGGGQQVGTEYNVTWVASANTISQINLFVRTTVNGDFVRINSAPIDAALGSYLWDITTEASPSSQIKISDADNPAIFDISDSLFTISEIKLEFPNGGNFQKFQIGRNYDISWTSNFINNIRLEYKLNDNSTQWLSMDRGISVDAALGKFNWNISSGIVLPSKTARVRISDSDFPTVRDVSDTTFTICLLNLDSPNERIPLKVGTTTTISWSSTNIDSVLLFLNPGNGLPLVPIAGPINANVNNSYQWQIPANLTSGNAKIRITDFDDANVFDESDTTFVIGAFPKFNVTKDYQSGTINIPWEFATPNETLSIINVTYQKVGSTIIASGTDALDGNYQDMVGPIEADTIKWNSKTHLENYEGLINLQFDFLSDFHVVYSITIDSLGIDNLAPRFDINSISFATDKFIFGWDKVLSSWLSASDTSKPVSYSLYLSDNGIFTPLPTITTLGDTAIFTKLSTSKNYDVMFDAIDNLGNTSTYAYKFKTNTAADYNDDNIIDGADLSAFVKSWSNADSLAGADFYPYTDTIPNINVGGDLLLDVNDILVFVNMWNYYQVNRVLPKAGGEYFTADNVERKSLKMKNGMNDFKIPILLKKNSSKSKSAFSVDIKYNNSVINFDSLKILHNGKIENTGLALTYIDSVKGIIHVDYADLSGGLKDNYEVVASVKYETQNYSKKDSFFVKVDAYDQNLGKELINNYMYSMIEVPTNYALYQNYPNPFNPSTTIMFDLPIKGKVILEVYDILGRKMATLINEVKDEGHYKYQYDFSSFGRRLASGVYLYRLLAGKYSQTKKMLLLK